MRRADNLKRAAIGIAGVIISGVRGDDAKITRIVRALQRVPRRDAMTNAVLAELLRRRDARRMEGG